MRIYLGPFEWRERISSKTGKPAPAGVYGWRMPLGALHAIDLSPMLGAGTPDERKGSAIFVCDDAAILAQPFVQLADDPMQQLGSAEIEALRGAFRVSASSATRFVELLHELFTTHGDVSRTLKAAPRIAGRDGTIRWALGMFRHAVPVGRGSSEWTGIRARHQEAYRTLYHADLGGRTHSKYLATLALKYGLSEAQAVDDFIPADLPKEAPVEPSTTITESFTGTSNTFGGDQTWTEASGDWDNETNQGACATTASTVYARCEGTLSSDDMRVQVATHAEGSNGYVGPMARFDASAITGYASINARAINDYYGQRITAGASTDIITSELGGSISLPSTDAIEVDGDQVEVFEGANSRGSTTDTNHSGQIRGGMALYHESTATRFDSWQAQDLVEPPSQRPQTQRQRGNLLQLIRAKRRGFASWLDVRTWWREAFA